MSQNQKRKIVKRTISSLYVLNCFKCFQIYNLGQMSPKKYDKKTISSLHMIFCDEKIQYFQIVHIKNIIL